MIQSFPVVFTMIRQLSKLTIQAAAQCINQVPNETSYSAVKVQYVYTPVQFIHPSESCSVFLVIVWLLGRLLPHLQLALIAGGTVLPVTSCSDGSEEGETHEI